MQVDFNMITKKNTIANILIYWLPAVTWAGIIFYLSGQSGLSVGLSNPNETLARKLAHMIEFGVLAWLVWRAFHFHLKLETKSSIIWAIFFSLLYAISDEMHQMFVADRAGRPIDVLVDLLGSVLILQVVYDFEKEELRKELAKGNPVIVK